MAVQDEASFKRYAANGIATVYAIPFLLLNAADLQVVLDDVEVTTGFAVSGVGTNTGSITFDVAPSGDLLLQRVVPFERLTDYQDNGDLLARTVNLDFDRLWLAMQELRRDDSTALRTSPLEPEGIPALPVIAMRAGKLLGFDEGGDPITSTLTIEQIEEQPALALDSAQAAAASAASASSSAGTATAAAGAAVAARDKAEAWAEEDEDVPVEPGQFSAKHWAAKAAGSVGGLNTRVNALEAAQQILHVRDQKASGTNGGTFTSGAWRTRDLNTVITNTITGASLSSNQITLPAGTYDVEGVAPHYQNTVSSQCAARARLYNVTAAASLATGTQTQTNGSGSAAMIHSRVRGRFTLAATSVVELQHYATLTVSNTGFGSPMSMGEPEIYSDLIIRRVS